MFTWACLAVNDSLRFNPDEMAIAVVFFGITKNLASILLKIIQWIFIILNPLISFNEIMKEEVKKKITMDDFKCIK